MERAEQVNPCDGCDRQVFVFSFLPNRAVEPGQCVVDDPIEELCQDGS